MLVMSATVVSAEEMANVRRWAQETATLAGPKDEYMAQKVAGTTAALDWVEGRVSTAPVSGLVLQPTRQHIEQESVRAKDAEDDLRRDRVRGTYPGSVHVALEFVLGRADSPF
jgi:hypothetical protein